MEEIFIQALAERSKKETGLLDKLPEEVKEVVETRIQENEIQNPFELTEEDLKV